MRGFLAFAAAERGGEPSLPRLKGPKRPRSVPRPVAPDDVVALAEEAGEEASAEWIAARDYAVLLLLYGSGLRVAEALGLTGAALPLGEALSVTGKRAKTRIVPLLAPVRAAIERYLSLCPWPPARDEPLFRGARGGPLNGEMIRRVGAPRPGPPRPFRPDHAPRPAPQLRHPPARPRRRPALASGAARPCQPLLDPDLHRGRRRPPARRLPQRPSAGVNVVPAKAGTQVLSGFEQFSAGMPACAGMTVYGCRFRQVSWRQM